MDEGDIGEGVEREDGGCTRKRGRASRIEGRFTDQHNRHCQPTTRSSLFPGFTFGSLTRARARPDHSYHPPLRPLIVSAHTAPSVISIRHRPLLPPTPGAVFLCHLVGSSSACQQSRLRIQWHSLAPCPNRASCLTPDAARHTRHHCKALVPS